MIGLMIIHAAMGNAVQLRRYQSGTTTRGVEAHLLQALMGWACLRKTQLRIEVDITYLQGLERRTVRQLNPKWCVDRSIQGMQSAKHRNAEIANARRDSRKLRAKKRCPASLREVFVSAVAQLCERATVRVPQVGVDNVSRLVMLRRPSP